MANRRSIDNPYGKEEVEEVGPAQEDSFQHSLDRALANPNAPIPGEVDRYRWEEHDNPNWSPFRLNREETARRVTPPSDGPSIEEMDTQFVNEVLRLWGEKDAPPKDDSEEMKSLINRVYGRVGGALPYWSKWNKRYENRAFHDSERRFQWPHFGSNLKFERPAEERYTIEGIKKSTGALKEIPKKEREPIKAEAKGGK